MLHTRRMLESPVAYARTLAMDPGADILEEPGCILYQTAVESETPRSIAKKFDTDPVNIVQLNQARFGNEYAPISGYGEELTPASRLVRMHMLALCAVCHPSALSMLPAYVVRVLWRR